MFSMGSATAMKVCFSHCSVAHQWSQLPPGLQGSTLAYTESEEKRFPTFSRRGRCELTGISPQIDWIFSTATLKRHFMG